MSDSQQGAGWWLASDRRWYPPELHSNNSPSLPPPPPGVHTHVSSLSAYPYHVQETVIAPGAVPQSAGGGLSVLGLLAIVACVLYAVSPVDILPEAILGPFGLPDDLIAVAVAAKVYLSSRRD